MSHDTILSVYSTEANSILNASGSAEEANGTAVTTTGPDDEVQHPSAASGMWTSLSALLAYITSILTLEGTCTQVVTAIATSLNEQGAAMNEELQVDSQNLYAASNKEWESPIQSTDRQPPITLMKAMMIKRRISEKKTTNFRKTS